MFRRFGLKEGCASLHDSLGLRPTFAWLVEVRKDRFPLVGPSGQALPGPRGHRPCPLSQWDPGVRNTKVKHKLLLSGTFIEQFSSHENYSKVSYELAPMFPIFTIMNQSFGFDEIFFKQTSIARPKGHTQTMVSVLSLLHFYIILP